MKRFEDIGAAPDEPHARQTTGDPIASSSATRGSALYAAQFIGQAFVTAYNLIVANKDKVEASPTP